MDNLHVFVHCVTKGVCSKIWKVLSGIGYDPVCPPFGFFDDGVLEIRKTDFLDIMTDHDITEEHSFAKTWIKNIFESELVEKIVVED